MLRLLALVILLALNSNSVQASKNFPVPPRDYVYDETGWIDAQTRQELVGLLSQEDQRTHRQIIVAVFKSLEDEEVVDYTNRLYTAWKIGSKDKNEGVLFAVYAAERKTRIEVGYGLEPVLTDALSKRILTQILKPAFQEQQYSEGILKTTQAILSVVQGQTLEEISKTPTTPSIPWVFIVIFGIFIFQTFLRYQMRKNHVYNPLGYGQGRTYSSRSTSMSGWGSSGGWGGGSGGGLVANWSFSALTISGVA
jgi:uncharacterized protein